jgi:guanylate kinase
MNPGKLFLIGGPSAAGKTSLGLALAEAVPNLWFIPRHTTRNQRIGELDTKEYSFVSAEVFKTMASENRFIEHRSYEFGMSYGLSQESVNLTLRKGNGIALMNLDRVKAVNNNHPGALTILLSVRQDILEARLRSRGTNNEEQIAERLENARVAGQNTEGYSYVVKNEGEFQDTLQDLIDIVKYELRERS